MEGLADRLGARRTELAELHAQLRQIHAARVEATKEAGKQASRRKKKSDQDESTLFAEAVRQARANGSEPFLTMAERKTSETAVNEGFQHWLTVHHLWVKACLAEGVENVHTAGRAAAETYVAEVGERLSQPGGLLTVWPDRKLRADYLKKVKTNG